MKKNSGRVVVAALLAAVIWAAPARAAGGKVCERCSELVEATLKASGLSAAGLEGAWQNAPFSLSGPGSAAAPQVSTGAVITGTVAAVYDGDTFELRGPDGRLMKVRFSGIDTPEKTQPFGPQAREFTAGRALEKTVSVRVVDIDKYGRTVGMVSLSDGTNLCAELLRAGLAWWYRQYSTDQAFGELESAARASRQGLWAQASPEAPWDYRRRTRDLR